MAARTDSDALATDLARFEDQWTKTAVSSGDQYSDMPDGTYDAIIEEARLTETTSTGRPVVIWRMRIQGPQEVNRLVTKSQVITENTLGMLKDALEKCHIQVSRLSELPAKLAELTDRPIGLDKRTKDGRSNFFFRWTTSQSKKVDLDDDIPF